MDFGPPSVLAALVAALVFGATAAADAALTTGKCLVQKRQAWSTFRKCQAAEEIKQLKGKAPDFAKCETKFQEKLAKITTKAAAAAIPCRYRDNGDESVTDYDTGLHWEQKSGTVADPLFGFCVPEDLNCVNDIYDWIDTNRFVEASDDGATFITCVSGKCDWRLPTVAELRTILLAQFPCGTNPCIDPIFGPTARGRYWTATTGHEFAELAYTVDFRDGDIFRGNKSSTYFVRRVRRVL